MKTRLLVTVCLALAACSNPKKPHVITEPVVQVELAVTAEVNIATLITQKDVKLVELEIYRGGRLVLVEALDFSRTDSKQLDPEVMAGRDIQILAKAYDADGNLLHYGYTDIPFVSAETSSDIDIVLNWSLINGKTAGLHAEYLFSAAVDGSDQLWLAAQRDGVLHFNGRTWKQYTAINGVPGTEVREVICDRLDRIWAATDNGIAMYENGIWTAYQIPDAAVGNDVWCIREIGTSIWCGTTSGASALTGGTWQHHHPGLGDVKDIYRSLDGTYWVATLGQGIKALDDASDTGPDTFTVADGLPCNFVWSVMEPEPGILWFGTSKGAVSYDGTGWTLFDGDIFNPDVVYAVGADRDDPDRKWFVTAWNLDQLVDNDWQRYEQVLSYMNYNNLYIDSQNRKWFTTSGNGLVLYLGD